MRLWHKDLIDVLPRQQLISQWRECCAIARNIAVNGTPNHILVNPIMNYPIEKDFYMYCINVIYEMDRRGYIISKQSYSNWYINMNTATNYSNMEYNPNHIIFDRWHNKDYLVQCYYNLQEKYHRGGISDTEWICIDNQYNMLMNR